MSFALILFSKRQICSAQKMLRTQLLSASRHLWTLGNKNNVCNKTARLAALVPSSQFDFPSLSIQSFHSTSLKHALAPSMVQPSFLKRMMKKIPVLNVDKYRRKVNASFIYEDIVKNVQYSDFFKELELPDTFCSWFLITELHVWMMMTRYMEEAEGQDMRNTLVSVMWEDVNARSSQLENANKKAVRAQIQTLSHQFNAAIIGYDEGIQCDDKVLAGAVWRRFFQCEGNNPEMVEKLVYYIRKQMHEIEQLQRTDVLSMRKVKWLDFRKP